MWLTPLQSLAALRAPSLSFPPSAFMKPSLDSPRVHLSLPTWALFHRLLIGPLFQDL